LPSRWMPVAALQSCPLVKLQGFASIETGLNAGRMSGDCWLPCKSLHDSSPDSDDTFLPVQAEKVPSAGGEPPSCCCAQKARSLFECAIVSYALHNVIQLYSMHSCIYNVCTLALRLSPPVQLTTQGMAAHMIPVHGARMGTRRVLLPTLLGMAEPRVITLIHLWSRQ